MADITNTVKSKLGREKAAKAITGNGTHSVITTMVFGNGGVGADGKPRTLTGDEASLFNQILSKPVEITFPKPTTARFTARVDADIDGLVGNVINEVGLIDSDGVLITMKTFTDKNLDSENIFEIDYDSEF